MQCPRLDHFVRFNTNGSVTCCGHMVKAQGFDDINQLQNSEWIESLKDKFFTDQWPDECIRCQQTEELNQGSIRLNAIDTHKKQTKADYLIVGGTLDNTCNSACQTCNSGLSTLIGKLDKTNKVVDNASKFWDLPQDRIVHLDINGGEPSVSQNYQHILKNLPPNLTNIRVNTNCASILHELTDIANSGVHVTVTVSLDGIGKVHDYLRWPIAWDKFYRNLMIYKSMPVELNTWTTVSALNIGDFANILDFVGTHKIDHSWALLDSPAPFNVKYKNTYTEVDVPDVIKPLVAVSRNNQSDIQSYIGLQDKIRGINVKDYLI
jgi:hypothetical protein